MLTCEADPLAAGEAAVLFGLAGVWTLRHITEGRAGGSGLANDCGSRKSTNIITNRFSFSLCMCFRYGVLCVEKFGRGLWNEATIS